MKILVQEIEHEDTSTIINYETVDDVYFILIRTLCDDLEIDHLSIEMLWSPQFDKDKWLNPFRHSCKIYVTFKCEEDAALFMLHYTEIDIGKI